MLEKILFLISDKISEENQSSALIGMIIFAVLFLSFLYKRIVSPIFEARKKALIISNAQRMRNIKAAATVAAAPTSGPTFVRKTDLVSEMSLQDKQIHADAMEKIKAGKIKEGAIQLESIKFQRAAITILEQAGLIEDAAQMLLRLGATGRTGALYERHHMYEKAAEQFFLAKEYQKSGELFFGAAKKNFLLYEKAIACFTESKDTDRLLSCYEKLVNEQEFIKLCVEHSRFDRLVEHLSNPIFCMKVFEKLSYQNRLSLLAQVEETPRGFMNLSSWMYFLPKNEDKILILKSITRNKKLCEFFWRAFSVQHISSYVDILIQAKEQQAIQDHGEVLKDLQLKQEVDKITLYLASQATSQ